VKCSIKGCVFPAIMTMRDIRGDINVCRQHGDDIAHERGRLLDAPIATVFAEHVCLGRRGAYIGDGFSTRPLPQYSWKPKKEKRVPKRSGRPRIEYPRKDRHCRVCWHLCSEDQLARNGKNSRTRICKPCRRMQMRARYHRLADAGAFVSCKSTRLRPEFRKRQTARLSKRQ
jgi:hypothetical protein